MYNDITTIIRIKIKINKNNYIIWFELNVSNQNNANEFINSIYTKFN